MGLDIGFYRDGEEVFSLRNHDEFFEALAEGSGGDVYEGYSDFYVTLDTLAVLEGMIEDGFTDCGLSPDEALADIPDAFHDLDARDTEWKDLLRYYPAIFAFLAEDICENGTLICGWSA